MAKKPPYPFVKWLGGKARMAKHVLARLPNECDTYYEPMVGGGAVFVEMAKAGRFKNAVLSDTNWELITTWRTIKSEVPDLIKELKKNRYVYDKKVFLEIRKEDPTIMDPVRVAARFIYLNRTCFNGLYRVNGSGKFNSPFGKYTDPVICDIANLKAVSGLLANVEIRNEDFEGGIRGAGSRDAIYFDPPYIPISSTSNFDKYTAGGFNLSNHERLSEVFSSLADKGARVVLSNSSSKDSIRLYGKFDIDRIIGSRSVGGPADCRGSVEEILAFAGPKS